MERGNGSRGVATEAIASLDRGDGTLEVSAVQQLRELQEAVAQDEQLGQDDTAQESERGFVVARRTQSISLIAEDLVKNGSEQQRCSCMI